VIHAVWHLLLTGVEYFGWNLAPWTISVLCFSILVTWTFRHTGGSVLMPMLMHASNNTVAVVWRMFEGADLARLWWVCVGIWVGLHGGDHPALWQGPDAWKGLGGPRMTMALGVPGGVE
jgi:membrane protease YdiL (CAAX protease family)